MPCENVYIILHCSFCICGSVFALSMTLSRALGDDTLRICASAILSQCILNDQILPDTRVLGTTCCLHLRFLLMCGSNIMTSAVKC